MGTANHLRQFDTAFEGLRQWRRVRRRAVLVGCLLLVACGDESSPPASEAVAEPAGPGALDCGSETVEVHGRESEVGEAWIVDPDPGLGPAELLWRQDLNGDGLEDLALSFPQAGGNWGEVPMAAYAACGSGRFLGVWGPDYVVSLESGEAAAEGAGAGQPWIELIATRREGEAATTRRLEFARGRYRGTSQRE